MNIKFMVNDDMLIWTLLFQASISESVHKLKQKLWFNYKEQYNNAYRDKELIMKDVKNFIPNDDTIYNIMLENKEYERIKKRVEKYRIEVLALWDKQQKLIRKSLEEILKKTLNDYTVLVVDEQLEILELSQKKQSSNKTAILGRMIDKKDPNKILIDLLYEIVKKEIKEYPKINQLIAISIVSLAIHNELATRLNNKSYYFMGEAQSTYVKRQIYPYWLMYLGVLEEDMSSYMLRDKIAFDLKKYPYNPKLKDMNIEEFIDFCIQNKRNMIHEEQLELI